MPRRNGALFLVWPAAVLALTLAVVPAGAEPITLATLGDSLTDTYVHRPYSGDNLSWTDQLKSLRSAEVTVFNKALFGTTSAGLLTQGQDTATADLVRQGMVHYATLIVGANDMLAFVGQLTKTGSADPVALVTNLVKNIGTALDTLRAAGHVAVVLGNLPDIGSTPYFQGALAKAPALLHLITGVTQNANAQIAALARVRGIPVVDLYSLNNRPLQPLTLGGVPVNGLTYGPDRFHPSTLGQGLIANSVLEAFRVAYHLDVTNLHLSDRDILREAGIPFRAGRTST
jgi:lysophospholipase L1-like esterase